LQKPAVFLDPYNYSFTLGEHLRSGRSEASVMTRIVNYVDRSAEAEGRAAGWPGARAEARVGMI